MIICGEISENTVAQVLEQGVRAQPYLICSGGGDTAAACALFDFLSSFESTTVAVGQVASAAVPIFAAGHTRLAFPSATFLWHESFIEEGQPGRADDLGVVAEGLRLWNSWGNRVIEERIGQSMTDAGRGAGSNLNATEAVELGLVHEVLDTGSVLTELVKLSLQCVPKKPAKKRAKKKGDH